MSPRRGAARCRSCKAPVLFLRSPFTSNVRTFDPTPVEPSHPLAGVKAFPVLGGTAAYKPTDLADLFQVQRQCSSADAAAEVQDVPWFRLHECQTEDDECTQEAGDPS